MKIFQCGEVWYCRYIGLPGRYIGTCGTGGSVSHPCKQLHAKEMLELC